jgi:uncharacterized membrane protein
MTEENQPPEEEVTASEAAEAEPTTAPQEAPQSDKDAPAKEKEEEIDELTTLHERTIAALSYFGFLAIVPFYLKKDSKFCRYHGKQGMTLAIVFFLVKFISVLDLIMDLALILQAVLALWLGFAALSGRWKKAPVVYEWSCQLEEALSLKTKEEEADAVALRPNQTKPDGEEENSSEKQSEEPVEEKKA